MPLTAIAALDPNRVIGRGGSLPWHLPEDLKLFKALTLGHPVLMGRRTWDSLPRRPLPGRENLVLSRTLRCDGAAVLPNLAALSPCLVGRQVFLIGGAELYAALLPHCEELILTHVHECYPGEVVFPEYLPRFHAVETLAETADFHTVRYHNSNPTPISAAGTAPCACISPDEIGEDDRRTGNA